MSSESTLDITAPPAPADDPATLLAQAEAALRQRQSREAITLARATDQAAATLDDASLRALYSAHALRVQARAQWQLGEPPQAYACAVQALPFFERLHDREVIIVLRDLIVLSLCGCGMAEEALPPAHANVDLAAQRPQLFDLLSQSLSTLAHVYASLSRHNDAELLHLQALSRARESADAQTIARAYSNILLTGALAYDELARKGQDAQARVVAQRQLKFAHQARAHMDAPVMSAAQKAMLRLNIGLCLVHAGQLAEARDLLNAGLALVAKDGPEAYVHALHLALGECELEQGHLDAAAAHIEPLLAPDVVLRSASITAPLLRNAIRLRLAQGLDEQAERLRHRLQDLEADQVQTRDRTHREVQEIQQRMLHLLQPVAPSGLTRF